MPRKLHVSTWIYTLTVITVYWALETEGKNELRLNGSVFEGFQK